MGKAAPVRIFISHSGDPSDLDLLDLLHKHLSPLVRLKRCTLDPILAGASQEQVLQQFDAADLRLLLLSPDYLAAQQGQGIDLVERAALSQKRSALSLLIRLRAVDYEPPRELSAVPDRPVQQHRDRDAAFSVVARAVRERVQMLARLDPAEEALRDCQDRLLGWRVDDPRALDCDRSAQWGAVLNLMKTPHSEVVLVPGADDQGHAFFLARVDIGLPEEPPRRVEYVPWPEPFPRSKTGFATALAARLNTSERGLSQRLSDMLQEQNLVLLHNIVQPTVADYQPLLRYYTEWLPEWLEEASPRRGLKVFQPIAWHPAGLLLRAAAGPLRLLRGPAAPHWARLAAQRGRARELMTQFQVRQHGRLPILRLHDLDQIRRRDVEQFCHIIQMPPDSRQRFIDAVLGRGQSPERVLSFIVRELDRYLWDDPEAE